MELRKEVRLLKSSDIETIASAFAALGWDKPASQYQRYLDEQEQGRRTVLVVFVGDLFAGYLTIVWSPDYSPFRDGGIPEIQDFNVLPQFRRRGIGAHFMHTEENLVS